MKFIAIAAALAAALAVAPQAGAQGAAGFPNKPVRVVVGYAPGGGTDVMARQVAQALTKLWGQNVFIENKPGAGGNVGAEMVAKAAPDGYTLLFWHDGLAANAGIYGKKLPFDPIKDLTPVQTVARVSIVMGVSPAFPAQSVKAVIDMAKAKPGALTYASCGVGTPHHIAGEMFKSQAQVDIAHTSYKGCAPALNDVLGGHVPIFFQTLSNVIQQMKSGKVRVLAIADPARLADYPDLPTMAESGLPGYSLNPWYGLFAPGGLPRDLLNKISGDIAKAVATPELQASLRGIYFRPETTTPDEFAKLVVTDIARLGKVVQTAGITPE
jgi:tripartite-type tricarboxylate transporter receptor subunit TctC